MGETETISEPDIDPEADKRSANASEVRNATPIQIFFDHVHSRPTLVAGIVIFAFVAFIALDAYRVISANQTNVDLSAQLLAAELSAVERQSAGSLLPFLLHKLPDATQAHLVDADNVLLASTETLLPGELFDPTIVLSSNVYASALLSDGKATIFAATHLMSVIAPLWLDATIGFGLTLIIFSIFSRNAKTAQTSHVPTPVNAPGEEGDILAALPVGVARWSTEGALLGANPTYCDFLKLDAKELRAGAQYRDIMAHATKGGACELIEETDLGRVSRLTTGAAGAYMVDERPTQDGGFITFVSDVSALRAAECALDDVQDVQRALSKQLHEEKIRAESASRAKTSFLAHLSHDVRTPLNHIIGFADLIAHQTYGPVGDKRYLNYVRDIKGSGEKLLASFAEILELAQLEGGHLVMRREQFEVAELVSATASRFKEKAQRAGVSLDISTPANVSLRADRLCVERMIGNIVENAIQFTPVGGRVRLTAWTADDGVVLEISDTGIGISEDRLIDLAQPFVLGDAAFTRESTGVGLGIAIARAIAELSGGKLAIDSSPTVGTTVAISLPLRTDGTRRLASAA